MSFYDRHVLPSVIGCACRTRAIMRQRAKLIPLAQGEVLVELEGAGFRASAVKQRYLRKTPRFVGWTTWGEAA